MTEKHTIRIVCQHEEGRPTTVATMTQDRAGRWNDWGGPLTEPGVNLVIHDSERSSTTKLVGNRRARTDWRDPDRDRDTRSSHTLACRRCGLSVAVRGERLDTILDRWSAATGDVDLPLRGLTDL